MNQQQRDQELAERRAAATPRDWSEDFDQDTGWNVCERCIRPFLGVVSRTECRACAERKAP